MLPPIDEAILEANPKFAVLHATLANNILNPNGSTKNHPAQKERDAVTEKLKQARIRAAKSHLLITSLQSLDPTPIPSKTRPTPSLPPELIELLLLLSSHLTSPSLSPASTSILESTTTWASLTNHLPQIGSLLSHHLQSQALALARIHAPTTNASYLHRTIPRLVPDICTQQTSLQSKNQELASRRTALVSKTTTLLSLHHLTTTLTIQTLEQVTHGSLTRHLKSRTDFLSLSAQTILLQTQEKYLRGEKMVYTDEVRGALVEYVRHLRDARERLKERRREAERVLWGYGVGREREDESGERKEKVMKEIGRVYGELRREVEEVGRDVERLKGR